MTASEYQAAAMRTAGTKNPMELLVNGVMGLAGESGECVDMVKKHLFQGHDLDREHLMLELGDVCWYLAITAQALDYDLGEVFEANIAKLRARYPIGFDAERSRNREPEDV